MGLWKQAESLIAWTLTYMWYMIYDDIWYETILISTFGKVAINGAQQKLNDKLVEEEERLWQVKFPFIWFEDKSGVSDGWNLICGQIFFLGLPLFLFRYVTKEKTQEVLNSTKNKRAIIRLSFFWVIFFIRSYTIFRTVQRLKKKQDQKDARTLKMKLNSSWIKIKVPSWWQKKLTQPL